MKEPSTALPFSRPVSVKALPDVGTRVTIEATAAECQALAQMCGLIAIANLEARLDLKARGSSVRVSGTVSGVVTQTCTVSLDPFDATIEETVDLVFMSQAGVDAWLATHRPHPNDDLAFDDDPPDAIVDGKIDLGAIAAEFLALGLAPYPRKPGVDFATGPEQDEKEPSPFAALAQWKKNG